MTLHRFALACLALLVLAAAFGSSRDANAEPYRIGRMSPNSAESDAPNLRAFREGLRELGWREGRDYVIEARFADGRLERLPGIANELVKLGVQLVLVGSTPAARAAKGATTSVPIVVVTTGDPVEGGLVDSLARPGGNVTGLTALAQDLNSKRLELLKEGVSGLSRVAALVNPHSPQTPPFLREKDASARALGLEMSVFEASEARSIDAAFTQMASTRPGALIIVNDILFIDQRKQVVDLVTRNRLPAVYGEREFVEAGGLMFYGASLVDLYRRAALHTQRVLKGAKPSELPFEQPTRFDLVINLKAARAIGLVLPRELVLRADQLIN